MAMSTRLLVLCPGQGGQDTAMFDLARTDQGAASFLDRCALTLDPATMFDNRMAQPLVVAATLAMWQALRDRLPAPTLVTGYSIGELAAHAVAGAIAPLDAVTLAARRAALMDEAAQHHPGQAMVAVSALSTDRARSLAQRAGFEVAIVTGEDSCIVGGLADRFAGLDIAVHEAGGRLQRLPVAVASHTSLMAGAAEPFAAALETVRFASHGSAVLAGVDASRVTGRSAAVTTLSRQLAQTIQWSACMDAAAEAGITVALELGPGAALSRMLQSRHPQIACRSTSEFRSIGGVLAWIERQFE
jgi:[acyl-carrier-protein] S-malonyltransferase